MKTQTGDFQEFRSAGNCNDCGYPRLLKSIDKYGHKEWELQSHKCEFIPTHILLLLDSAKAKRLAKDYIKKYRINSDDKIVAVSEEAVADSLMGGILHLIGEDAEVTEWWNSGFPPNYSISSRCPDHYQLAHYARTLIKELL